MKKWVQWVLLVAMLISPLTMANMETQDQMKQIYFAGGCFWGTEHMMAQVPGVTDVVSGYANGTLDNPTYERVLRGDTGHRETVRVTYDPNLMDAEALIRLFYATIDPTVKDQQGNDRGTQYQTGIYYADEETGKIAEKVTAEEREKHDAFHVEVLPLTAFWEAEEYHQDYLIKNPGGYCHLGPADFELARNLTKTEARVAEYRRIDVATAKDMMDKGEVVIVDVRTPGEFDAGHVEGAINLPLDKIETDASKVLADKDATILLYCRSGSRSRAAGMMMVSMGYTGIYDFGGVISWPYGLVK
ncbi:MAG: peptide-methionine (S)-S-oxide reductase MsrA [Clostridiales bacterium]|nr:peptide-methionine (S)-S-oxide reductase MsrA [Clostridiales bacterium]